MTTKPSPRDLDPKFQDAQPTEETPVETVTDTSPEEDSDTHYIAHTRTWIDSEGVTQTRTDRMPMADWPAYQKKWNL